MSSSSNTNAPVTLSMGVESVAASDAMTAEFLHLPEVSLPSQDLSAAHEFCFVQTVFFIKVGIRSKILRT